MVLFASTSINPNILKAADLGEIGNEKRLKIKNVTKETDVGERQETKAVRVVHQRRRGLLLNKTNLRILQGAFGDTMDGWPGKIVVLYSTMAELPRQDGPRLAGADSAAEGRQLQQGASRQPSRTSPAESRRLMKNSTALTILSNSTTTFRTQVR